MRPRPISPLELTILLGLLLLTASWAVRQLPLAPICVLEPCLSRTFSPEVFGHEGKPALSALKSGS